MKEFLILLFALFFTETELAQPVLYVEESEDCTEKIGREARCVEITECPVARENIKKRINPTSCGFTGMTPLVCCPTTAPPPDSRADLCGITDTSISVSTDRHDGFNFKDGDDSAATTTESDDISINEDGTSIIQPRRRFKKETNDELFEDNLPWMVLIFTKSDDIVVCNGVIVDKSYVLTAAHCFAKERRPQNYYVQMENRENFYEVNDLRIHQQYQYDFYHDVAILKLSFEIEAIIPICLPPVVNFPNYFVGKNATVLNLFHDLPDILDYKIQIVETEKCDEMYTKLSKSPFPLGIRKNEFMCAFPKYEVMDSFSKVNSGVVALKEDGRWMVLGIGTVDISCDFPTYPVVYTYIPYYLDWIKSEMVY